ncbi:MAG TPA: hypothetical protein VG838_02445 [Opitutaceae bacterium]|nr:hypothetical protein [Opitutaceae bacterium]
MVIRIHSLLTAGLALLLVPAASAAPAVKQFPLDERVVYEIPISGDAPTTLMFPSALTAIEAANVSASPETPAPVLLAYTPGRTFFSVRALEPAARAAINVVWKNKTFVLHFFANATPYGSVTFYEDDLSGRGAVLHRRVTPETLLGLLDRAKSFALVSTQYPEAVQQIERSTPGNVTYYRDFRVTVEEVYRFDPEDTLVFRLRFENTGGSEVVYQPQRLAVRVGQNVYYASIADASGIVPPKATTTGFFAVTGSPRGGRANLSVRNFFAIVVPRVERDAKLIVPQ